MGQILSETIIKKPRKIHKCYLCGNDIITSYIKFAGVDRGEFFTMKNHIDCHKKMQNICSECEYSYDCESDMRDCFYEKHLKYKDNNNEQ